ncbi:MAG: DUF6599 family protein [Acidobacteriota bacterium]
MLRRVVSCSPILLWLALTTPAAAQTTLWPDQFGQFAKTASRGVRLAEAALWEEYGFQQAEEAEYASGATRFSATAVRLKDPTGALAAFQWQRPADATTSKLGALAVETAKTVVLAYGNYLFRFEGYKPQVPELEALFDRLPRLDQSPLPTLSTYLPSQGLYANSERLVLGPESLGRFLPQIPPSAAAFHLGAEAQLGRFQSAKGEIGLAIFSYPTPHIAREQAEAFRKLPGALVKRAGPLVAVTFSPPDPDAAQRLLAAVRYEANLTLSQYVPTRRDLWPDLLINIFLLTGVLLIFCVVAGLAVGGFRAYLRRSGGDSVIMLHLEDTAARPDR